ncbi:MAG: glycosyltransferase family 2 protein [Ignavibacteriales bacterium]|nr:glycosyltransferase family 2 protein [Ignavibacteriales bacterium]
MEKISVSLITFNEEKNIERCLKSVTWADEIVVVDSGSKDRTVELAKKYTGVAIHNDWEGFAAQKEFALRNCTNDWVLSLDADEEVSEELQKEIKQILLKGAVADGFYIPRKTFFNGQWIKSCGWYPGYQLRLFRKDKTTLTKRKVHEGFEVDGIRGHLKGDILHYTHFDLESTISKINKYSTLEAEEKYLEKTALPINFILNPVAAFIQHYFIRRGFTDGVNGLIISILHATTNLMTYMKMWELKRADRKRTLEL